MQLSLQGTCKTCDTVDDPTVSFDDSLYGGCGEAGVCHDGEGGYYCEDECSACGDCEYVQDIGTRIVGIILSSITSILVFALKFAATCGFVQNCHPCIRCCFEKIGSCFICFMIIIALFFLIVAIVLPSNTSTFAEDWFIAVAISWLQWPLYSIPMYIYKFEKKKKKFQDKYPGCYTIAFDPTYVSTENPMPEQTIELSNMGNPLQQPPQQVMMMQQPMMGVSQNMQQQAQNMQQQMMGSLAPSQNMELEVQDIQEPPEE